MCDEVVNFHSHIYYNYSRNKFLTKMSGNTSCCCFICVREMDAGVIENCGKFSRVATAGFSCLTCPFETVRGVVSLQVATFGISPI
jgi:hypothetical protein